MKGIRSPSEQMQDQDLVEDQSFDLEDWLPITASRNANWYYSAFHNVTAIVGAGVLGLPYAMSELGWGPGVVVLILSWVITLYTLWQMIEMHEMFEGKRFDRYHELGQAAFGKDLGLYIIVPLQLLVEISVCIVYMVTGGKSLKNVHDVAVGDNCTKMTKMTIRHFILIFASSQFVLSLLNNFNSISGVSLVAAVMSVSYSTIAWVASLRTDVTGTAVEYGYKKRTNSVSVPLAFLSALGEMAFAYNGHNVVLEIQATIPSTPEKPSKRPMWKGAIVAYIIVAFCYFPVALVGFHTFGNNVKENIFESLTKPKALVIVANMFVVIHLLGSYQVYAMPVFDMIESVMIKKCHFSPTSVLRFTIRWTFVAATMSIAVALPYFSALLSFFGGFVYAPTTYFMPCIIWLILKKPKRFSLSWFINWMCIILGVLLMIIAPIGGLAKLIYNIRKGTLLRTKCEIP
ncbi:Lysine histidine transporter-like 4 [Cardamine amara subsp. amara]|uniref:Lysine histidine transporter-like 4 n=1 Tax=Cardamine amara subsp. amara TaxID=228776 RepID=A0ABD1AWY1_CARAN